METGTELIVNPKTNQWRTVGNNGAEFDKVKKGEIVFNASQTKALLKNGHINSRGKAYAGGKDNYSPLSLANPEKFAMLTSFESFKDIVIPQITDIKRNVEALANKFGANQPGLASNMSQNITLSIGDIQVSGVNDVNGLSKAIVDQLPNQLLQELHRR